MKVTFFGHGCFSIKIGESTILIDPIITPNELAKEIDVNAIKADFIALTHGHEDHIYDAESIAKRTGAQLIANFEVANWFQKKGVENTLGMNIGGIVRTKDFAIKMVSAMHSSSLPDGTYGGQPGGFVIETQNHRLYISGDTALTYDMKLIPDTIGELDLAILPVGDNFTMGIKEAIKASSFLNCSKVLGVHFDTFGYIKIDHKEAFEKFAKAKKELYLLPIGGNLKI